MAVHSLTAEQIDDRLGVRVQSAGYAIPYPNLTDQTGQPYIRVRLQVPHGRQKYCGGKGDDPALYVPPTFHSLPAAELLVITEGEKKAAKAVQEGIPCVAVQGVWSWAEPGPRAAEKLNQESVGIDTEPLTELVRLGRRCKHVLVLGDSDLLAPGKEQAQSGMRSLSQSLRQQGIAAHTHFCPPSGAQGMNGKDEETSEKVGLDDWLQTSTPERVAKDLRLLYLVGKVLETELSEAVLAAEFANAVSDKLAYSPARGWMVFDGGIWREDEGLFRRNHSVSFFSKAIAEDAARLRSISSSAEPKGNRQKDAAQDTASIWRARNSAAVEKLGKAADQLGKRRGIETLLNLAQPHLIIEDQRWDRDPHLLGVVNGILDLRTGMLREADPSAYLTRSAGVAYSADASSPQWQSFLERVQPSMEIRLYLQRLAGYTMTGSADEQAIFLHVGDGANGKSTFWGAVSGALGAYSATATSALVDARADGREQLYQLAQLDGARLVNLTETESHTKFAMAAMKRFTGGEAITARHPFGRHFTFHLKGKLHLSTNHAPQIDDSSHGAWRRIKVVPWPITIAETQRDPRLPAKLREELPGILAWMAEGARMYLRDGLAPPTSLSQAAGDLRSANDDVQQFLDSEAYLQPDLYQQSSPLYAAYRAWAATQGFTAKSTQAFSADLECRGFQKGKDGAGCMVWRGLVLRQQADVSPVDGPKKSVRNARNLQVISAGRRA